MLWVEGLQVAYGQVQAVRGIDLHVEAGQIVTLIGANGAGKSSTLAAIAGLVTPSAGTITFEGQDITRRAAHAMVSSGVVLVPEGRAILGRMTVEENLELGAFGRRDRPAVRADRDAFYERFPVLGLRRKARAGSLSGGEQQMLAIARGLMARPRLLLLDEPSMGLAPRMVQQIFAIVREIHASGTTILLVEQNARAALAVADRGYVLETGIVVLSGTGPELLASSATVDAYLGGVTNKSGAGTG